MLRFDPRIKYGASSPFGTESLRGRSSRAMGGAVNLQYGII
jgi:hypothetical protein